MARFRCKPCPVGVRLDGRGCEVVRWAAIIPAGGCGAKDQVSRTRAPSIEAESIEGKGGAKARMELVLKGRGTRVARRVRQVTEHKLGRLERIEPALIRVEVVVTIEKNPRQGGLHRVEAAASTPRRTYRAHAGAKDVDSALDVVAHRLERQILDHHTRRRTQRIGGAGRVKSALTSHGEDGEEGEGAE